MLLPFASPMHLVAQSMDIVELDYIVSEGVDLTHNNSEHFIFGQ